MAVNRLSSVVQICLLVGMLLGTMIGCATETGTTIVSCESFSDPLRSIDLDEQTPTTAQAWAVSTYNIPEAQVRHMKFTGEQNPSVVGWDANGEGHTIYFIGEQAVNASMIGKETQPTLQQVLDCLGEPTYYGAYFNEMPAGWLFELELWYPEEGLMVEYAEPVRGRQAPALGPDFPMEEMTITRPGDLESVVRAAYEPRAEEVIQVAL